MLNFFFSRELYDLYQVEELLPVNSGECKQIKKLLRNSWTDLYLLQWFANNGSVQLITLQTSKRWMKHVLNSTGYILELNNQYREVTMNLYMPDCRNQGQTLVGCHSCKAYLCWDYPHPVSLTCPDPPPQSCPPGCRPGRSRSPPRTAECCRKCK